MSDLPMSDRVAGLGSRDAIRGVTRAWWLFLILGVLWILFGMFVLSYNVGSLLALAIFVPKVGDIGGYTVGKLVGRTPFAPRLSPKKTWAGAIGGFIASALDIGHIGHFFDLGTWLIAIGGAVLLLLIIRAIARPPTPR